MTVFYNKILAFLLSVFMLFGVFGGEIAVKSSIRIKELDLNAVDVTNGCAVDLPAAAGNLRFNRVSFSYEATAAVRAVFTYKQGVKTLEEELLLSAGGSEASMLLNCYQSHKTASRLLSVRFEPIVKDQACVLSVSGFTCDIQTRTKDDVLYMENERYKVGVSLKWGGGLCYFEDKAEDRYGNLLNCHDTGRLVQQSYYGPDQIEGYENGVFMGNLWSYNPVQGGDQYGNSSKLVAVEKTDGEIRVVCRPLDWAQNGMFTRTYYTNIYKLTETGLTVQNTAVDFLQAAWPRKSQELPAFYTISALGSFWFYDGDRPWTDAPLRAEHELPFWAGKPAFGLRAGNTETWCAWADDTGYGVGLFTPEATSLLAGRFEYDGTADAGADPTNYVAPLGVFNLTFDEPHTYVYYLTTGTVEEIRSTFRNAFSRTDGDL